MPRNNLQRNADYWAQRMKNMEDALLNQSYSYVENLDAQFRAAEAEVERQMSAWYRRFAANNDITLADAKRLLNSDELAEFRWTVEDYIKHGEENALTGAWMKELENASARVHISRLDALKIQLQQQAELLYSNQLDYLDTVTRQAYAGSYYHTAYEIQKGLGVGWTMQAINENTIKKVLSRPWTTDGQTFRDRCWTNKQSLVNSVNTQLTQMIIRGEPPDKAISAIAKQFEVSRSKAGRLVMTESAYFSSTAQQDCFKALGVEQYQIVASFDRDTCSLCAQLDGKVFRMSDYQVGLTAPPFHPWCRCCTCPYYADMEGIGERWTRNPDGTTKKIPANTTFDEWRGQFVTGKAAPPKAEAVDVTSAYMKKAVPGAGAVTYDKRYKTGRHKEEIKVAEWLHRTFGGDIRLLNEADAFGMKMPDYEWGGRLWELKTLTSVKAADDALRRGLKQIQENPGGIILDYGEHDIDLEELKKTLTGRFKRGRVPELDIMILADGKTIVLRYKK